MARQHPVGLASLRKLDAGFEASEPHDFAVRGNPSPPKASTSLSIVRLRAIRQLTGLVDPPCHPLASPDAAAPTPSRPAFVTTRDPPLLSERDGDGYRSDLGQARNEIFLQRGLDRPFRKTRSDLPVRQSFGSVAKAGVEF